MKHSVGICHTCHKIVDTILVTRSWNFEHNNTPCGLLDVDVYACIQCGTSVSIPKHTYRLVEERRLILNAHAINHSFSNPATQAQLDDAVARGMIPIDQLVHNQWYVGYSRNTTKARWDADRQEWFHYRMKWRWIEDYTDPVSITCTTDMFVCMAKTIPDTKHLRKEIK